MVVIIDLTGEEKAPEAKAAERPSRRAVLEAPSERLLELPLAEAVPAAPLRRPPLRRGRY